MTHEPPIAECKTSKASAIAAGVIARCIKVCQGFHGTDGASPHLIRVRRADPFAVVHSGSLKRGHM